VESTRFDQLTKTVGSAASRRATLRAVLGALLSFTSVDELTSKGRGVRAAGPCGNGSAKANACEKDKDCCTHFCKKGRCRCKKLGQGCKKNRNCCAGFEQPMTCQNGTCQSAQTATPPPPPPLCEALGSTLCNPSSGSPGCSSDLSNNCACMITEGGSRVCVNATTLRGEIFCEACDQPDELCVQFASEPDSICGPEPFACAFACQTPSP
jgi:hypothetical protein